jgi:hypothetical protein
MTGLPWSHEHITVSQLKIMEESLPAELRLTEAEVQVAMEYAAVKVEKDGSDSHGERGESVRGGNFFLRARFN